MKPSQAPETDADSHPCSGRGGAIRYRNARLQDAAALAAFSAESFVDSFGHLYPPEDLAAYISEKYGSARQSAEISDPLTHYRLALRGKAIVGYCKIGACGLPIDGANGETAIELHRLYVDESAKGAGVAQTLMDEALAWARARGARALYLSVWENNHRAQNFYRRYGFEHIGEHGFMVGRVRDRDFIWQLAL